MAGYPTDDDNEYAPQPRPLDVQLTQEEIDNFSMDIPEPEGINPYVVLAVVIVCLGACFLWGNEYHLITEPNPFGPLCLLLSIATPIALFGYLVWRDGMPSLADTCGPSSYFHSSALGWSVIAFLVLPFFVSLPGYTGMASALNCLLDTSAESTRTVTLVGTPERHGKMDIDKRVWVDVIDGTNRRNIPVPWKQRGVLNKARSMQLTTRAGAFGCEWVTAVERAEE